MKRAVKLDVLTTEVALQWAQQLVDANKRVDLGKIIPGNATYAYLAGVKSGYMQAISDLRLHGYLESEK